LTGQREPLLGIGCRIRANASRAWSGLPPHRRRRQQAANARCHASILAGIGRIETFESPTEALDAIGLDIPYEVFAASSMQPLTGPALVKTILSASYDLLCFVPAVIMNP
jgi:hypothetical protein